MLYSYSVKRQKQGSGKKKRAKNKPRQDSCLDIYVNRLGRHFLLEFQQRDISSMEDLAKVFRLYEILINSYSFEYRK